MDAIWTTMEEWGSSVELDYGIFCLIPILVILIDVYKRQLSVFKGIDKFQA